MRFAAAQLTNRVSPPPVYRPNETAQRMINTVLAPIKKALEPKGQGVPVSTQHSLSAPFFPDIKKSKSKKIEQMRYLALSEQEGFLLKPDPYIRKIEKSELKVQSEAGIRGLRTFTAGDYVYINAALRGDEARMLRYLEEKKRDVPLDRAMAEGIAQARIVHQALEELPWTKMCVYRGARLSMEEFDKIYWIPAKLKKPYVQEGFDSRTKSIEIARRFANGKGDKPPRPDQNVSVLFVYIDAWVKDIEPYSEMLEWNNEKEVLTLPGSVFAIDQVVESFIGEEGCLEVPAKAWFTVYLKQIS
jgi:hypothetical protein